MTTRQKLFPLALLLASAAAARAAGPDPISYKLSIVDAPAHLAHIEATFPTAKAAKLELMMPLWTPGYYRQEDYAGKVKNISAKTAEGKTLAIDHKANRWTVDTGSESTILISYDLLCDGRSVTGSS